MTRRNAILLGTLAVGAAVAGYALLASRRAPAEDAGSEAGPLGCRFSVGERLAFRLRATSDGRTPDAPAPQHMGVEARMWWRVLEERPGAGWLMAASLAGVRLEGGAAQPALETP